MYCKQFLHGRVHSHTIDPPWSIAPTQYWTSSPWHSQSRRNNPKNPTFKFNFSHSACHLSCQHRPNDRQPKGYRSPNVNTRSDQTLLWFDKPDNVAMGLKKKKSYIVIVTFTVSEIERHPYEPASRAPDHPQYKFQRTLLPLVRDSEHLKAGIPQCGRHHLWGGDNWPKGRLTFRFFPTIIHSHISI